MRRLSVFLILALMGVGLCAQANEISASNNYTVLGGWRGQSGTSVWNAVLGWKPELFAQYYPLSRVRLSADMSMDNRLQALSSQAGSEQDMEFKLYRAWGAASWGDTELKGGLQHIRMGPAQILRPLQWFDQLTPGAFVEDSPGVAALTLSHFFPNPELRLWVLPGTVETKGAETLPSQAGSWEYGGRLGLRSPLGETGISGHLRTVAPASASGSVMREYRLGLDQRVDDFMGGWFEAVVNYLDQDPAKTVDPVQERLSGAATLGGDYTFGIGNGLYLLAEGNVSWALRENNSRKDRTGGWYDGYQTACLLSYPLGLFDGLQMLASYDFESDQGAASLAWRRTYDLLGWELAFSLGHGAGKPDIWSQGVSLIINYDI